MDKNKGRTDMLAAGRKKLQQFRQKKDGKGSGSQGKSSKKSGKSAHREADAESESGTSKPESTPLVPEQGIASHDDSDPPVVVASGLHDDSEAPTGVTSASRSTENVARKTADSVDGKSAMLSSQESSADEQSIEESTSMVEAPEHNENEVVAAVIESVTPVVGVDATNSVEETASDISNVAAEPPSVDSTGESLELEHNALPPQEDIPDSSLVQTRGDQVTDLGSMQEADGLDGRQTNYNCELELDGMPEVGKTSEASPAASTAETYVNTSRETEQAENVNEVSILDVAKVSNGLSGADLGSAVENHQYEENPEPSSGKEEAQDATQGYRETELDSPAGARVVSLPDLSSVSLSQLTNLIKALSEEEFDHVHESRRLGSGADRGFRHLLERLKEELVLTNFTKDISQMQLAQHSELQSEFDDDRRRLVDEIALLSASLKESSEKNQCLSKELLGSRDELQAVISAREELQNQFRSSQSDIQELSEQLSRNRDELQAVISAREELQNQFHSSHSDVQELSGRVNELQIDLERSQGELSSLTTELADCKDLVTSLQSEIEILNGSIASSTEDRNKLQKEKDSQTGEIGKLLAELEECKTSLALLHTENLNMAASFSSLDAAKKMVEEEKENLRADYEKLSAEFSNSKEVASMLQLENSGLKESLDILTEERRKLDEDKRYFAQENERLSSELIVFQDKISTEQRERERSEVELKEMSMRIEEIIEENIFLSSSLEVHKARLVEADRSRDEMPLQSNEAVDQVELSELQSVDRHITAALNKPLSDGGAEQSLRELEAPTGFVGFDSLRVHLEEAEKILHQLEKANEVIQAQCMSFDKPGGKPSAPGISKLIQAFESKVQSDEQEAEQVPSAENRSSVDDPFVLIKEEIGNLKALFNQLVVDAKDASALFKEECNSRKAADVTVGVLKEQYKALKEAHTDSLEARNVELSVICEVVKQYEGSVEAKNNELAVLCEASKQEVVDLKAENAQLGSNLRTYESRVCELQVQLNDLQQCSEDMVAGIGNRAEAMEKEVSERVLLLEQDWNSTLTRVFEIVQKLSESTGNLSSAVLLPNERLDVVSYVDDLVNQTTQVIKDMQNKSEDAQAECEVISTSFKELNKSCDDLHQKNDLAAGTLHNIYFQLKKLVSLHESADESDRKVEDKKITDLSDYANYRDYIEQLEHNLMERLEFESVIKKLNSELIERKTEFEELERGCLRADVVCKLIERIESVLKLEDAEIPMDELPYSRFERLVSTLLQKYGDANEQLCLSKDEFGSSVTKSTEMEEEIQQLISAGLQHETEISVLRESLNRAEEILSNTSSELQKKTQELEQSEQHVSSIREKLSIAVAKGKGLVVLRDSLKQSLAETSSELERCIHELQLKSGRLNEVEEKLKVYSEAGERIEALESELSYIRNSATGLRESFLLKDSALQRIEEILEQLDLPEHFHSRDILEKVEWLAGSASGNHNSYNALPAGEWDRKSSGGGGSYSETGSVPAEPWKDDAHVGTNIGEDLRRKYEELQSRFYGLAEQNEMLEQSLMERNDLVQRWEELLDKIDMPSHLRSTEPEDRIQWLGRALSDARDDADSLQEKLVNFENFCGSLNGDLEDSHRRISELEINRETISREKEHIYERLEILSNDYEKISSKATQYEVENKRLQSEVTRLEESHKKLSAREAELESENKQLQSEVNYLQENVAEMLGNKDQIQSMEGEIRRLQGLVSDFLQDPETQDQVSYASSIESLEASLKKLMENYNNFSSEKQVLSRGIDVLGDGTMTIEEAKSTEIPDDCGDSDAVILKKELDEALEELIHAKEDRDLYIEKQHSLGCEIEALVKGKEELELLLSQEAQKLASTREKLNVAVRKGKTVVQHRDSLKQTIEAMNADVEKLKSEIEIRESKLSDYENRFRELSSYPEKVGVLESEIFSLRNRLAETEQHLQETRRTLSLIWNNLSAVNVGNGADSTDPVEKSEQIVNLCRDLHADLTSSEEESRKSKRAAELLLAELNEVQERNDNIQEELSELTNERDVAKAAVREAHSRLDELYDSRSSEQRNQFSELKALKSDVDQFRKGFNDVSNLLVDVCSKDLEFLQSLEKSIDVSLNPTSSTDGLSIPAFNVGHRSTSSDSKGLFASWFDSNANENFDGNSASEICASVRLQLQELIAEVGALKEKLKRHSSSAQEQASSLSKALAIAQRELVSQNESHEALKMEITQLVSAGQEKDNKLVAMQNNFTLVFEVLSGLITEIQSTKGELLGMNKASGEIAFQGDGNSGGLAQIPSEESIKIMADKLSYAVRDFANVKAEFVEGDNRQMKSAIADLQRELQEKDVQKERICMDLVAQIKVAEAAVARSSADLHSSSRRVDELENRLKQVELEKEKMEQKANELLDQQENSKELQQMVRSLTDTIAAKDQEIESLMQALDEEETQMEDQTKKIEELERILQQKNSDLENVESSRGKIMKKLSITVSKFDELHELSASLLAEVEKLQSQLQERDADISFLRQEVTRCTNEVLVSNKRDSDDILEFSTWLDMIISNAGMQNIRPQVKNDDQVQEEHKELLKKKIESVILEFVEQREVALSKDTLLQAERSKVGELARKEEILQRSLRDKESRLNLLEGVGASEEATGTTSEIVEVEPLINKWTVPGPSVTSQVRSLRKANNDQVAIAIDMDHDSGNGLEDEDDDKVHGFKSLTTSRIVPRFTRPVAHMVDGLWVSCDRALMRQPAFRLGIIIYWAVLHALLATLAI